MSIVPIISFCAHVIVNAWLLLIMWRQGAARRLPWFACYIASELLGACVGSSLWFFDRKLYVIVFWWLAAAQIGLVVGAVRESFVRTFVGFSSLRWFPWLLWSVIGGVLAYSVWKAIFAPPVHNNRIISLIVAGEFTFRWGIIAVGLLSLALATLFRLPKGTWEMAVIDGCTITSIAFLVLIGSRSLFGTRFSAVMQYVPEVGYLLAACIWIKFMSASPSEPGFKDLGLTPEQMEGELKRYRKAAERLFG
jgi:hypothetical protein